MNSLRGQMDPICLGRFRQLNGQLSTVLLQEESFWKQRAKQHWLQGADRNTKFFHQYATHRKRKNSIVRLKDRNGVWKEGDGLVSLVTDYYKQIFQTNGDIGAFQVDTLSPRVTRAQNDDLLRPFEPAEVKHALFAMGKDKSPGPDGMNPGFYQSFWDLIGKDFTDFVLACLSQSSFPPELNDANIVLISEKAAPELVADLRPIALCNVVYKVMAKMIANRMKPLLDDIVSESQSAFLPGRLILDNILIASEETMEVKHCLEIYEQFSGQSVNFHKSNISFNRNTTLLDRDAIAMGLGVEQAEDFGKYLGLPSVVGRNRKFVFSYVEQKLRQRFGSWNKRLLSMAGKEVLLKSVAQAMPTYTMSIFLLPVSLCASLERLMNMYWWGKSTTVDGIHWMAWDRMCVPKKHGGMGFKRLHEFNLALLEKQRWRLLTNPESLMARIFKARYYRDTTFYEASLGGNPSYVWRSIMTSQSLIRSGCRRRIGNGRTTKVWEHPWLPDSQNPFVLTDQVTQLPDLMVADL
ncbi:PREDICTED: uncharacterized protein LOC109185261 [Ipomoea nil]|uniref:uncharacterized protein LOC109185261 n=1 Tax=Ipomoea nil TaxID=35883 RepID=UPI0009017E14|nr:PREDICTED: uncharacterized protein LOC109185261 [Ipomoea nil]